MQKNKLCKNINANNGALQGSDYKFIHIYIYMLIECAKRESAIQEMEEINQLIDINV